MKGIFTINPVSTAILPELKFRAATEKEIPFLRSYFERFPSRSCDFSLGGLLMWREYFDYEIAETLDSLIIMGCDPASGVHIFYEPKGSLDDEIYKRLIKEYCEKRDWRYALLTAEQQEFPDDIDRTCAESGCIRDWTEYLYDAEKIATFAGRKMEKKRNHLNYFINNYSPFDIEAITQENIPELIDFTINFELNHNGSTLAEYEARQVIDVLQNFQVYGFDGLAVRKDGKIIGFAFGETIGDTFFAHVEKGDISYRGIYQLLASRMSRMAMELHPAVKYVNREEDMGDESLRQSKLSYHPSKIIYKKLSL